LCGSPAPTTCWAGGRECEADGDGDVAVEVGAEGMSVAPETTWSSETPPGWPGRPRRARDTLEAVTTRATTMAATTLVRVTSQNLGRERRACIDILVVFLPHGPDRAGSL
jgi:hypothetical protein